MVVADLLQPTWKLLYGTCSVLVASPTMRRWLVLVATFCFTIFLYASSVGCLAVDVHSGQSGMPQDWISFLLLVAQLAGAPTTKACR